MKRCFFLDDPESEGNSDSGFTPRRKSSTNSFSSKERNYESVPSALIKASESKGCSGSFRKMPLKPSHGKRLLLLARARGKSLRNRTTCPKANQFLTINSLIWAIYCLKEIPSLCHSRKEYAPNGLQLRDMILRGISLASQRKELTLLPWNQYRQVTYSNNRMPLLRYETVNEKEQLTRARDATRIVPDNEKC